MQLDNESPWAAAIVPGWGADHNLQMTCVVKIGYQWDDNGELTPLSAEQCEICYQDEYANDDPETGSVVQASDTVPFKSGFEWLLTGTLKPKPGATQQTLSVSFHHPELRYEKKIVATGQRFWKKSIFGLIPSEPEALTELPICYEHAFGGRYAVNEDKVIQYDANPVGIGFYKARDRHDSKPVFLPTYETLPLLTSTKSKPTPAGFNALSLTWAPRDESFKKIDSEAAAEGRCPYPLALEKSIFNCAPADQRFEVAPPVGTKIQLAGFSEQTTTIVIPEIAERIRLLHVCGSQVKKRQPQCDTLLINTDAKTLVFIYRQAISWHPTKSALSQLQLMDTKQMSDQDQQQPTGSVSA